MDCRVNILFMGKEYSNTISYLPSDMLKEIPPYILNSMSQEKPIRFKELQEKAGRKQIKQKEFILNSLTGKLGEYILKDFLISRGFKIRARFNPGDYSGEYKGKEFIIEVKTFRNAEAVRLKRKQVSNIKVLAEKQGKKALFYVLMLYPLKHEVINSMEILTPPKEVYTYRVQVIRCINPMIKGRMIRTKLIAISRNELFKNFKSTKYPCFYYY